MRSRLEYIIGPHLKKVANVYKDGIRNIWYRPEDAFLVGIFNLEATDLILEEKGNSAEITVGPYTLCISIS